MKPKTGKALLPIHILFFLLFIPFSYCLHAQTSFINGIVNSYYKVTEILPDNDGVRVSNPSGLSQYDKVLIIQMKGATINTTNTVNFGDTTSLNNAGNYEIATICSIDGDKVYLFFNLLRSYTVTEKVQLVRFAQYSSAVVTDTIKASPWNNGTGTGGIIAISVKEDLTLNAPLFADSSGFRGGTFKISNGTCGNGFPVAVASAYYYDAAVLGPQNGGWKGEAITDLVSSQTGGRGAPANGGGGGNNHNNGGGGGANLTAGGRGGGNSSSAGCTANLRGEAGKPLKNWSGSKIFFGGGGGAGHANDAFVSSWGGGNGGGIVFIQANNLISNNSKITANGHNGGPSLSDGASGAGAGGTIIMDILNSYSGTLAVQANGGAGGTADDGGNINRCYGAGGGGSGGMIYFTGAPPVATILTTAGAAGSELSRNAGCSAAVPAQAGAAGNTLNFYDYSRSFDPTGSCHAVLPLELVSFHARIKDIRIELDWKISNPEQIRCFYAQRFQENRWTTIDSVQANVKLLDYAITDPLPNAGMNRYRIQVQEKSNHYFYSPVRQLLLQEKRQELRVYPNPSSRIVTIDGEFKAGSFLEVVDLNGRTVWRKQLETNNAARVSLPKIATGMYVLRVNTWKGMLLLR